MSEHNWPWIVDAHDSGDQSERICDLANSHLQSTHAVCKEESKWKTYTAKKSNENLGAHMAG